MKTQAKLNIEKIVRGIVQDLGYDSPTPDIAVGVDDGGAGDQGMMFGYAVAETPQLMPLPITLAHELVKAMDHMRETKILPYLRPDGKSQVVVKYEKGKPVAVKKIVLAVPHDDKGAGGKEGQSTNRKLCVKKS